MTLPEPDIVVLGSFEELSQVFRNLIDNALKYGREGGRVELMMLPARVSRPGMVGLAVVDDGPGIAREHIPRLTERFFRVSVAGSRARGGTGLGLAIVKHVLNRHRGHFRDREHPRRGLAVLRLAAAGAGHGALPGPSPEPCGARPPDAAERTRTGRRAPVSVLTLLNAPTAGFPRGNFANSKGWRRSMTVI